MDKELHRYVLRLPRLLDSSPGVHPDISLGNVSWRDDDLELSRFSGDRYRYKQPSNSSKNSQTEGVNLHFSKENGLL